MPHDIKTIQDALRGAQRMLHSRPNVVATGVGYKVTGGRRTSELSIVCSVARKQAAAALSESARIPASVDGIATDVVETGKIRALQSRTDRLRPAPGGVSIGHRDITAGTLGCLVKKDGRLVILSNNHVLANSNAAVRGDAILQPGPIDGGRFPADQIAELLDFVPIRFTNPQPPSECSTARTVIALLNAICRGIGSNTRYRVVTQQIDDNLVDAAIAEPTDAASVTDALLDIGTIGGVGDAGLGTVIKKSGRTTGFTTGEVLQVSVTVDVDYGSGRTARFTDQLLAGPMSQGGDSGSAVLDQDNRLVGLLFAGGDNTTIINRIGHVFTALGVSR